MGSCPEYSSAYVTRRPIGLGSVAARGSGDLSGLRQRLFRRGAQFDLVSNPAIKARIRRFLSAARLCAASEAHAFAEQGFRYHLMRV